MPFSDPDPPIPEPDPDPDSPFSGPDSPLDPSLPEPDPPPPVPDPSVLFSKNPQYIKKLIHYCILTCNQSLGNPSTSG